MIQHEQNEPKKLEKIKLQQEVETKSSCESKVKFEINSKTINVPYLNLFQYSRIVQLKKNYF